MIIGFEQLVDTVRTLPDEQQVMLQELITKWQIEARRIDIAHDAQESLAAFRAGQLTSQPAQTIIAELQRALSREE